MHRIKITKKLLDYLQENKIYTKTIVDGKFHRLKCGFLKSKYIFVPDTKDCMESYSVFKAGNNFYAMGSFSYSGSNLPTYTKVGRYCSIASEVEVFAFSHPINRFSSSSFTYEKSHSFIQDSLKEEKKQWDFSHTPAYTKSLIIENDVWIGKGALLKPGIKLHNGCVVGQRTVVTKDVPPYAVVVGNPARIVKYRFSPEIIQRLLKLEWWKYHFADFNGIDLNLDIEKYLDCLEERINKLSLAPYETKKVYFNDLINL